MFDDEATFFNSLLELRSASGFSMFEDAQYRGVAAAERVLASLGVRGDTLL
ncbi:MAG TPA: hypothetical protein VLD36_06225 [Burkholderiales bacterium]|nr:hypothetical protein [Burkholderiales bacterium]